MASAASRVSQQRAPLNLVIHMMSGRVNTQAEQECDELCGQL